MASDRSARAFSIASRPTTIDEQLSLVMVHP